MATPRPRLLVVDDEPAIREVTYDLLTSEGYEVSTAEDGMEAMEHLVDPLPDLVISDLRMPNMSGVELLALVRERFPQVPVIAMSGEFTEQEVPANVLADAFLQKGAFTFQQLCSKIVELMSAPPMRAPTSPS